MKRSGPAMNLAKMLESITNLQITSPEDWKAKASQAPAKRVEPSEKIAEKTPLRKREAIDTDTEIHVSTLVERKDWEKIESFIKLTNSAELNNYAGEQAMVHWLDYHNPDNEMSLGALDYVLRYFSGKLEEYEVEAICRYITTTRGCEGKQESRKFIQGLMKDGFMTAEQVTTVKKYFRKYDKPRPYKMYEDRSIPDERREGYGVFESTEDSSDEGLDLFSSCAGVVPTGNKEEENLSGYSAFSDDAS